MTDSNWGYDDTPLHSSDMATGVSSVWGYNTGRAPPVDTHEDLDSQIETLESEIEVLDQARAKQARAVEAGTRVSAPPRVAVQPLRRYSITAHTASNTTYVDAGESVGDGRGVPSGPWRENLIRSADDNARVLTVHRALAAWLSNPRSVPPMPQAGGDVFGNAANNALTSVLCRVNNKYLDDIEFAREGRCPPPWFADSAFHVVQQLARELSTTHAQNDNVSRYRVELELMAAIDIFNSTCPAVLPDTITLPGDGFNTIELEPTRVHPIETYAHLADPSESKWAYQEGGRREFRVYITTDTRNDIRTIMKEVSTLVRDGKRVLLVDGTRLGTLTKMLLPFDIVPDTAPFVTRHARKHRHTITVEEAWMELTAAARTGDMVRVRTIACVALMEQQQMMSGGLFLMRSEGNGASHDATRFEGVMRRFGSRIRAAGFVHGADVTIMVTEASFPSMTEALVHVADTVYAFEPSRTTDMDMIRLAHANNRTKTFMHVDSGRALDAIALMTSTFTTGA